MRQRLGIAAALLRPRDLLVLDEPTNGLDPQGTREVRHLIRELADEGTTVFVSSHLLAEVEQICTHAAVLSRGRLVADGEVSALRGSLSSRLVVSTPDGAVAATTLGRAGLRGRRRAGRARSVRPVGDVEPDVACAALVARRGAGARSGGRAAVAGGGVRRADR